MDFTSCPATVVLGHPLAEIEAVFGTAQVSADLRVRLAVQSEFGRCVVRTTMVHEIVYPGGFAEMIRIAWS